ncbi:hypothetical protein B0H13DRAFT_2309873 [Mycena leptocephala]|nr:hypothetical protein B0H13DRAFT_2309873 [Mycena leptocephala]
MRCSYLQWLGGQESTASDDEEDDPDSDSDDEKTDAVIVHRPHLIKSLNLLPPQTSLWAISKQPMVLPTSFPRSLLSLNCTSSLLQSRPAFTTVSTFSVKFPSTSATSVIRAGRAASVLSLRDPAVPPKSRSSGSPAIFDTALVIEDPSQYVPSSGIAGLRPAQIRGIFKLPPQFGTYVHPLAYIEWFTPLNKPDPISGMFTTHRSTRNHTRNSAVVSGEYIVCACHLMAKCGNTIDPKWTSLLNL